MNLYFNNHNTTIMTILKNKFVFIWIQIVLIVLFGVLLKKFPRIFIVVVMCYTK